MPQGYMKEVNQVRLDANNFLLDNVSETNVSAWSISNTHQNLRGSARERRNTHALRETCVLAPVTGDLDAGKAPA